MAVYTHLDTAEIAEHLASRYDLGALREARGIAEGIENSNYRLELEAVDGTAYPAILTVFERRTRAEDLPFFMAAMEHLAETGAAVPRPYAGRNGSYVQKLAGKASCITSFLHGTQAEHPSPAQLRALGEAVARMHGAGASFPLRRPNDFSPFSLSGLAEGCGGGLDGIAGKQSAAIRQDVARFAGMPPLSIHRGLIHADLFPDNVFFEGDTVSGIIDFYFACSDYLLYDLAVILVSWCMDASGNRLAALEAALLRGYESVRPLLVEERDALPLLTRGAALRFFLSRAYDAIHARPDALATPKDPQEYLNKWRAFSA